MRHRISERTLELTQGDITLQDVDAIVNAANSSLAGGGGVDGAIHRLGGSQIMQETARRFPDGCPTGSAVITSGGNLAARFVIHAVGPAWRGGQQDESRQLATAYHRSFELAAENQCRSIAFPAISTGVYGYPMDLAARVALGESLKFLSAETSLELVRFVLFNAGAYGAFAAALEELTQQ